MPDVAPDLDVVAVGNAIVDVLAPADEAFLESEGVVKGTMALIDAERAHALYGRMAPGVEASGGSAANTAVGVTSLGGTAGFVGKVRDDQLGEVFTHDIRAAGVAFQSAPARQGPPTARCLILVTPDGQRTLNTFLGASAGLSVDDVDPAFLARGSVVYLEGYQWDAPSARKAMRAAVAAAAAAGRRVAFTLSDPFCVDRHRADFLELLDDVDVLFANEIEITSLFETDDFDAASRAVARRCSLAALTRSDKGSVVVAGDERLAVPAAPVTDVVDTTGAGDLYAAGFLWALARGHDLGACARVGGLCAAEVISHWGPRPQVALAELVGSVL